MGAWQGCQGNGCAGEPRRARWLAVKIPGAIPTQAAVPAGAAASPGVCISKAPGAAAFVARLFSGALSREGRWMGGDYRQWSFPVTLLLKASASEIQESFECT